MLVHFFAKLISMTIGSLYVFNLVAIGEQTTKTAVYEKLTIKIYFDYLLHVLEIYLVAAIFVVVT